MRILLVHNAFRTFVRIDRDILASKHIVEDLDLSSPLRVLRLADLLPRTDLVFCWFAGLHALAPALAAWAARKPVISVVGAYDAANMPEIGFGHMAHPWKRYAVRTVCGASSLLICNSDYAVETVRRNINPRPPITRIHHGVPFPPGPVAAQRQPIALSVGQVRRMNVLRKGHEVFARASRLLPGIRFMLVGEVMDESDRYLRSIGGDNLELTGHLSQPQLESLYAQASVYVQPSAHESFGLSVVEAMGAGELAVVSRRGALPEVVDGHGIFIDETSPQSVADGISAALGRDLADRQASAEYVRRTFTLQARREQLLAAVESVL